MKVILLQDVPKLGKKYEVKKVSDGHALNFLIPRRLVEMASESAVKRLEVMKKKETEEQKIHEDLLLKNLKDIQGVSVEINAKTNDKGHLFASIHKDEIVLELKRQTRLDISPDYLILDKPIKEIGEHEIEVKVQDKTARFKLVLKAA